MQGFCETIMRPKKKNTVVGDVYMFETVYETTNRKREEGRDRREAAGGEGKRREIEGKRWRDTVNRGRTDGRNG